MEQISQRADRVLASLRPMDGTVALFSHGHFLRALAVRWIGLPVPEARHFALNPASLSILGHEPHNEDTPSISLWNAGPDAGFTQQDRGTNDPKGAAP